MYLKWRSRLGQVLLTILPKFPIPPTVKPYPQIIAGSKVINLMERDSSKTVTCNNTREEANSNPVRIEYRWFK